MNKIRNEGGEIMSKKGLKNSSMEQMQKDHETESAFQQYKSKNNRKNK
jgi:hypothetical protein